MDESKLPEQSDENTEAVHDAIYDDALLNMHDERREKRLTGEGKSYKPEESFRRAREHKRQQG